MSKFFVRFFLSFIIIWVEQAFAQHLSPEFQNEVVSMQVVDRNLYIDANFGGGITAIAAPRHPIFEDQRFRLTPASDANWYRIQDTRTGNFITVSTPTENALVNMRPYGHGGDARLQEFRFVAQTEAGRYKIHSRFDIGLVALVLEIDPAATGLTAVRLGRNITVGNASHQRFDLQRLFPDVDPSSAIATLADRFENRTLGFTVRSNGFQWQASTGNNAVAGVNPYPQFDTAFSIISTNEAGWFKIQHKASSRLLTLQLAVPGVDLILQPDNAADDNLQKFKFIFQGNDSTYKIHTKYSVGSGTGKGALVLEFPITSGSTLRTAANNTSLVPGADWNQQFIIRRFQPPAARFNRGSATDGAGKILSKQYYLTLKESLALLGPVVRGNDTFITWQRQVTYGEDAEWTIEAGRRQGGTQYFMFRYGKTNQYLFTPANDTNSFPQQGMRLQLKRKLHPNQDKRFEFNLVEDGSIQNWFSMRTLVAPALQNLSRIAMSDDGFLEVESNSNAFDGLRKFGINLSQPMDSTKLYIVATKNQGLLMSDSGILANGTGVYRIKYPDYSCYWHFIPQPGGRYFIQNTLTKQYLTNNGNTQVGTALQMTNNRNAAGTLWEIEINGNFYNIKNSIGGRYFSLNNQPNDGRPIFQGFISSGGTDWIIMRGDHYTDPDVDVLAAQDLLQDYKPAQVNALNNFDYRDKMMRNIGLPYEPAVRSILFGPTVSSMDAARTGINANANFLSVMHSALRSVFRYSAATADSAIRNYKLDSAGMRSQVIQALKIYILDSLTQRDRSSWSFDEAELVGYLERTMRSMRNNHADRIDSSWTEYQRLSGAITNFAFSALLAGPPSTDFDIPHYYEATDGEKLMLEELARVAKDKGYKNPGFMAQVVTLPPITAGGLAGATAALVPAIQKAQAGLLSELAKTFTQLLAKELAASAGAVSGPFIVITFAASILLEQAMEVAEYIEFDKDVQHNIKLIRSRSTQVSIMQTNSLLEKALMARDFDLILGTGERFTTFTGTRYEFNGNGAWSNGSNWANGMPPPAILSSGDLIINPVKGGRCIIDLPVTILEGARVKVIPKSNIEVRAPLKVPAFINKN